MRWCWHICRGSRSRRRDTTPCIPGVWRGRRPVLPLARRNAWMLQQADWVIVYVSRSVGNAASLQARAERSGKAVINLWELGEMKGAGRGK